MSTVEMPSALERLRMAVAEAGYDPEGVGVFDDGSIEFPGCWPNDLAWRAREVAMIGEPSCRACSARNRDYWDRHGHFPPRICVATRRFEQDCGVSR